MMRMLCLLSAVVAGGSTIGCGSSSRAEDAAQLPDAAVADLAVELESMALPIIVRDRAASHAKGVVLNASAGGSQFVPLLVDTGSVGLRLLADSFPDGTWQELDPPVSNQETFADGTVYEGRIVMAQVAIGSGQPGSTVSTDGAIQLQLVTQVSCTAAMPDCPGAKALTDHGLGGVIGIGMRSCAANTDVYSPLAQLPGNYASGYIIRAGSYDENNDVAGSLVVGLNGDNRLGATISLPAQNSGCATPKTTRFWSDDHAEFSWVIATTSDAGTPAQAEFDSLGMVDTGECNMHFHGVDLPDGLLAAPIPDGGISHLKEGVLVEGAGSKVPPPLSFSFFVGTPPDGTVEVSFDRSDAYCNLGIAVFFRYDVMFDLVNGLLGFSSREGEEE